jgi:hypothetical protein
MIDAVKGLLKVAEIPPTYALLFKACKMSFNSLNIAFYVEKLLLKPYWLGDNISLFITCLESLMNVTFSKIFEKEVNSDMDL